MKAGKWFHALGQADAARKLPVRRAARSQAIGCWPEFAKSYYIAGWHSVGYEYMRKRGDAK